MSFYDDMSKHFHVQIAKLIDDTASTCNHGDMETRDIMSLIVSSLFYETIQIAAVNKVNEEDFLHTCQIAYRSMMPQFKKSLSTSRKPRG